MIICPHGASPPAYEIRFQPNHVSASAPASDHLQKAEIPSSRDSKIQLRSFSRCYHVRCGFITTRVQKPACFILQNRCVSLLINSTFRHRQPLGLPKLAFVRAALFLSKNRHFVRSVRKLLKVVTLSRTRPELTPTSPP